MTFSELKKLDAEYTMQTYGRFQVGIERGTGATLYDFDGKEYIDFTSGIGVNSIGYGNHEWTKAITDQIGKIAHLSNLFYTEPYAHVAEKLCKRTGMSKAFFANSGAEANEGAIKLARKYSFDKYGKGRSTIITLYNSFHGRTITTLTATGQESFHNYFFPFTEGFKYAYADDFESLKNEMGPDVCAVMIELVQGEGGVLPVSKEFVGQVAKFCGENDLLLIVDEVQTGIGRTGTLFTFEQYGIKPDVVTFAKGIAGGLPLGGFLAAEKCSAVLTAGTHATTFGGNPVCCAAANAVLDIVDDKLLNDVVKKGEYLREKIEGFGSPFVSGTRGLGLMIGVIVKDASPKELVSKMIEKGVLCLTAGKDAVRLLPPLTISMEEIDKGLAAMQKVLCPKEDEN